MPDDKWRRPTGAIPIASEQPVRRTTGSFFVPESGVLRVDQQARDPRVAVSVPVKIRYESILDFHETQSVNISRSGMFLSCADPRPVGTIIDFELALADGLSVDQLQALSATNPTASSPALPALPRREPT